MFLSYFCSRELFFFKAWRYMRSILLLSWLNEKISPVAISAYHRSKRGLGSCISPQCFCIRLIIWSELVSKEAYHTLRFSLCCLLASSFWRNSEGETMNELNQSQRSCNFNEYKFHQLFLQDLLSTVTVCFGLLEECVNGTSNHWQSKRDLCYVCRVL